ncbi:MAG: acyl carrier protein [Bacillota bacterium]
MQLIEQVQSILGETLALGQRASMLKANTRLLGNFPELDSLAVINVISALEERFGIVFDDDEINAEMFETVGTLSTLVSRKLMQ